MLFKLRISVAIGGKIMNKSKLKKIIIAALVVASLSGISYFGYTKFFAKKTTTQSRYLPEKASVGTINVTVAGTGTVVSSTSKDIFAAGSGTLSNFGLKVGDTVKQGDSVGNIQDSTIDNQITQDQAKLEQAKTQLTQISNSLNYQLQNDQLKLNQANTQLSQMTKQTDIDNQNITIQQLQNTLNNDTNTGNNNISNQKIAIQQAQNTLNNDLTTKNKENLTAPISGTVVTVSAQNGDTLQNGKSLATVEDLSNLQLDVPVDELDIDKVKAGQKVDISFDDIKDKKYTGSVVSLSLLGKTTNNVTTYDVLVSIDNPDSVKLGMNANATIDVQSKDNALMVPSEAITTRNGKKYVMVPSTGTSSASSWSGSKNSNSSSTSNSSGRSFNRTNSNRTSAGKLVEVQTGLSNENSVEITSGLKEGETVLVTIPTVSSNSQTRQQGSSAFGSFGGSYGSGFGGGSGASRKSGN